MIFIRLDADHTRGMGHLFRMLSLSDAINLHKKQVRFIVRENKIAEQILRERNADYLSFPSSMDEEEIIKNSLTSKESLPDIWIYDCLDTESPWLDLLKKSNIKVVCFDDTKAGLQKAALVINSIVFSWGSYKKENVRSILFEGLDYSIISPNAIKYRRERDISPDGALNIGITMGGSDTHGASLVILNALSKLDLRESSIHLFTGPHFSHQDGLSQIINAISLKVNVKHNVENLHKELDLMDVVICNGGMTLFEACAMGLPALALANEPHEEINIKYIASSGGCLPIGTVVDLNEEKMAKGMEGFLLDRELLNKVSDSTMSFTVSGTDNCVKEILKLNEMIEIK